MGGIDVASEGQLVPDCTLCCELAGSKHRLHGREYAAMVARQQTRLVDASWISIMPSLGALNHTHILIVTKSHVRSFAEAPSQSAVEIAAAKAAVRRIVPNAVVFEHGAGCDGHSAGACVDHGHLHMLADVTGLQRRLESDLSPVRLPDEIALRQVANRLLGYARFEDSRGALWLANHPRIPKQYFRLVYSQLQASPAQWNWRADPQISLIRKTLSTYQQLGTLFLEEISVRAA